MKKWHVLVAAVALGAAGVWFLTRSPDREEKATSASDPELPEDRRPDDPAPTAEPPGASATVGAADGAPTDQAGDDRSSMSEGQQVESAVVDKAPAVAEERKANPREQSHGDAEIAKRVLRYKDTKIPIKKRLQEIKDLGRDNTEESTRLLMALGNEYIYVNFAAVEALGYSKQPNVPSYLKAKLREKDPRLVKSAVTALVMIEGEDAIPIVADVLDKNHVRDDGYVDLICTACVKALASTKSRNAVPVLAGELEQAIPDDLYYDYGSAVVEAIRQIGDVSGRPALQGYVKKLEKAREAESDNPMAVEYFEGKIAETLKAKDALPEAQQTDI